MEWAKHSKKIPDLKYTIKYTDKRKKRYVKHTLSIRSAMSLHIALSSEWLAIEREISYVWIYTKEILTQLNSFLYHEYSVNSKCSFKTRLRVYSIISLWSHSLIEETQYRVSKIIKKKRQNGVVDHVMIFLRTILLILVMSIDLTLI